MSAASQARKRRGPDDLEIVAFERGRHTSYSACGIPYYVGDLLDDPDLLVARAPEVFREQYGIEVRTEHEVTAIDPAAQRLRVRDLQSGAERDEPYDELVIGTGSIPLRPGLDGSDAQGIVGVQTLDDGLHARELVDRRQPAHAVVVGGGYIGLEMAEAMVSRGIDVTLVDRNVQPMPSLDPDMGELVADALRDSGVKLALGCSVLGFESSGGWVSGVRTDQGVLAAELVVLGLGVRPNTALAVDAGIPVGLSGGIAVDPQMRTRAPHVWAAGDCVESFHRVSRQPVVIALGTHANKQGRVAGINIGGGYATFDGVVGTAVSKICKVEVARTGLTDRQAAQAGLQHFDVVVESSTRAGYYPGAGRITTKLVVERRSGRLLGGQIVGVEGAAKRIDVLATALWNEMDVDEILGLDLAYAPPYAPVWDPVLIAARQAADKLARI